MEKLIDDIWNSSLNKIASKESRVARPSLGDELDLSMPQGRTLSLLAANPSLAALIYHSAYLSANRNAYIIMRKLNMPPDYFWKFEFWPKERALETMQRVINRVFTAIMNQNKEGILALDDIDIEHMRFVISFRDCAECAGIKAQKAICYYHAATFAGIFSALLCKDMDGYETKCMANGDNACIFVLGKKDDPEISVKTGNYLAPTKLSIKMAERMSESLHGNPLRSTGNMVSIQYYQLMITNSIISNPGLFASSSINIGQEYGMRLADVLRDFYKESSLGVITKYYNQMHYLDVSVKESGPDIEIEIKECAELSSVLQKRELVSFLLGELHGLVSALTGQQWTMKEKSFGGNGLFIRLSPKV